MVTLKKSHKNQYFKKIDVCILFKLKLSKNVSLH